MIKKKIIARSASVLLLSLAFLGGCKDGQQRDTRSPGGGGGGHSHYTEGEGAGNN